MNPWSGTIQLNAPLRDLRSPEDRAQEKRFAEQLQESYERGVRDGERKLGAQLVQQRAETAGLQNGVFTSLRQAIPGVIQECQDSLIALAVQVSQRLVAGIPITPEMVEGSIQEALSDLEESTHFTVLLNPLDLELMDKFNSISRQEWSRRDGVQIQSSPEVTRGGCIIQTRFGMVDARRETKMALLQKTLAH